MTLAAKELRSLIDEASQDTLVVRTAELELRGQRVPITLVTPDLLTIQEVVEEVRAGSSPEEGSAEFNGRYMLKLIPRIAYADFDVERMEGDLIFPEGDRDPVYRRLTRHPVAFTTLTLAAADVVRPMQDVGDHGTPGPGMPSRE
jgi:hypothetical protein